MAEEANSEQQRAPGFFQRLLQTKLSRREFVVGGSVAIGSAAIAAAVGLPTFFQLIKERDIAKGEASASSKLAAEEKEKRQALKSALDGESEKRKENLTRETRNYLNEYNLYTLTANEGINGPIAQNQSYSEARFGRFMAEQKRFILERGVYLVAAWDTLSGQSDNKTQFDEKSGRVASEGITFRINEDLFDFHLFSNIVKAKLRLNVAEDPVDKELAREDAEDLFALAKLRPAVEVDKNSWVIMPDSWATSLARFCLFLGRNNIPLPQKTVIKRGLITENKQNLGGFYNNGSGVFMEGQILHLDASEYADVVAHEGGHYIADAAMIAKRMVGLKPGAKLPNHQVEYERIVSSVQKALIEGKYRAGRVNTDPSIMVNGFPTAYAATNQQEDFAEMFEEFFTNGPVLRKRIQELKDQDPESAQLLAAKYEYMRSQIAGGEEFSFNGRIKRAEMIAWEEELLDIPPFIEPLPEEIIKTNQAYTDQLRMFPGFGETSVITVVPQNYGQILSLLEPSVWADLLHIEPKWVESVSAVHAVPHKEVKGKFLVNTGGTNMAFDPANQASVDYFARNVFDANSRREFIYNDNVQYSQDSREAFNRLGMPPLKPHLWAWVSSYPPFIIDNSQSAYLRLSFNQTSGHWETAPLEIFKVAVHKKSTDKEMKSTREVYTPIMLGDKDIIISFNLTNGNVERVLVNEGQRISQPIPSSPN